MEVEKVKNTIKEVACQNNYKIEDHEDGNMILTKDEEHPKLVVNTMTIGTQILLFFYTNVCSFDVDKLTTEKIKLINQINIEISSKLFLINDDEESTSHSLKLRQDLFAFSEEQLQKSIPDIIDVIFEDLEHCSKRLEDSNLV